MPAFNIKTNRTFSFIRKRAWIITLLVAIGGIWIPILGLLVIPIILTLAVMAFFKGRMWCGNYCPHGSLYDYLALPISINKKIPKILKSKVLRILVFTWFGYNMTRKFFKVFPTFGTDQFFYKLGFVFVTTYLMVLIVGGLLSVFISPRTWCQFCPMGTIQILSYKLGKALGIAKLTDKKVIIEAKEKCHKCSKCSRVCPMQLAPYQEFSDDNQFDNEKCIRCSTCVVNCPAGILSLNSIKEAEAIIKKVSLKGYDKRKKISAVTSRTVKLKDDITEYTFKLKDLEEVEYEAGQFILVKVLHDPPMSRAFSISSFNKDERSLTIAVKKMKDGYGAGIISETFKVGGKVELEGPLGDELVVDKSADKVLLVAGGIGITPFLAIARDLINSNHDVDKVKLIHGVNKQNEFIYDKEFEKLAGQSSKFEYIKVVASDDNWKGRKGFVTNVIQEMNLEGYKAYICGPKPMIKPTISTLKQCSVREDDIYVESA